MASSWVLFFSYVLLTCVTYQKVYISVAQTHDNFAFRLFIVACLILYNVLLHFLLDVYGTRCGGCHVGVEGYLLAVTGKKLSTSARSHVLVTTLTSVSAAVICTSGISIILF